MLDTIRSRKINYRLVTRRLGIFLFIGGLVLYAIWPWLPGKPKTPTRTIVVYGFSILSEVMNSGVFPAFAAEWEAKTGEKVEFISAFAGSGTITNQMILGVPAEVALLSTELDALRLLQNDVVSGPTWRDLPHGGVLNRTPFIILTRSGNPKGIQDFADLTRPDIDVVHPDPLTSGGAQWAILAEYGSVVKNGGSPEQAERQLLGIWQNVVAQSSSARGARTQFENGFGDALITYEQEALYDKSRGKLTADIVYPFSTILSEHTVVIIDRNVSDEERPLVDAFQAFLWSEQAQRIFVRHGFRSVNEALNGANPDFGHIITPFVVDDLGGWAAARGSIIDSVWKDRVLPELGK